MKIHTLLFYKFSTINNPCEFQKSHIEFCKNLGLKGRILVSSEGINGSVSGQKKDILEYKNNLKKIFSDILFKEDIGPAAPFKNLKVLVRDEIIALNKKINLANKAPYISSNDLKELYESGEKFITLDIRNDYEWKVGKFKNAVVLPIKSFREFPNEINKIKEKIKGKKIITYCTGGIRCEKATALMKENGFENEEIYQLKEGIINYCKDFPDTYFEGSCFVFDKRLTQDYNNKRKFISKCGHCSEPSDLLRNCRNVDCDKIFVICEKCSKIRDNCCSPECKGMFRAQCLEKSIVNQGKRAVN